MKTIPAAIAAIAFSTSALAAPGDKVSDVNVVNQVNVNVANPVLPVEISNADPVRVQNVGSADNPALQGFAANTGTRSFAGGNSTNSQTLMTVPAGKRAVVEHVSCIDFLEAGNNFVRMELRYTLNGATQLHQFVHEHVGTSLVSTIDVWSFSQALRVYADPGSDISVFAIRRTTTGSGGIECQASGHFVTVP